MAIVYDPQICRDYFANGTTAICGCAVTDKTGRVTAAIMCNCFVGKSCAVHIKVDRATKSWVKAAARMVFISYGVIECLLTVDNLNDKVVRFINHLGGILVSSRPLSGVSIYALSIYNLRLTEF